MWLNPSNPQLTKNGELHHLLTLEGLPAEILWEILDTARSFVGVKVKKLPLLRGKAVFNLFFEPSTRTRTTFEIAAKRLSADVINLNIALLPKARARACSTPLTTCRRCTRTCSSYGTARAAPHFIARHVAPRST